MNDVNRCGACESDTPATPQLIYNRPGLTALSYRVGTYSSFRRAMLLAIHSLELEIGGQKMRPLRDWSARGSADYGIALLEMWAYIADILTFYQERIANEAFLRTAILRESLLHMASLLDYVPTPGVAATVDLAFTLQNGATTQLPAGLRVQSVPGQDEKPQKFETSVSREARAEWNQLTPVTQEAQAFAFNDKQVYLEGVDTGLKPGDPILIVGKTRRDVDPGNEQWDFRILSSVEPLPDQDLTLVKWEEGLGTWIYGHQIVPEPDAEVFTFKRRVALFGHNAPDWRLMAAEVKRAYMPDGSFATAKNTPVTIFPVDIAQSVTTPEHGGSARRLSGGSIILYQPAPDFEGKDSFSYVVAGEPNPITVDVTVTVGNEWPGFEIQALENKIIHLDNVYPEILAESWIVLVKPEPTPYTELYKALDVSADSREDYTLTAKVTRLELDTEENLQQFGLRETVVFAESVKLPVGKKPKTDLISGNEIDVVESIGVMEFERPIIIAGVAEDTGQVDSEMATVEETRPTGSNTVIALTADLQRRYQRDSAVIFANVVRATHGETVAKVLGNGDASLSFQSFELKKSPVTYVPQAGAPNGAASTLKLRVNNILWQEVRSFYGHVGSEAIFTTAIADDGTMTVRLGDSKTGARPATGRNNVAATYRQGIGRVGNVRAETIKTLLDRPLGVKRVINPAAAAGGAEPESKENIRANLPNTVRTFGRIVSLRDFEDAAREFTGVAKARATCVWDREEQVVALTVAGDRGDRIRGTTTYANLLADLNSRRDRNHKLRVEDYVPVPVLLTATLYVDPAYLPELVEEAVRKTVQDYFDFDNVDLGQTVYLSDVYRLIQKVPGVGAVDIDRFRFKYLDPPARQTRNDFLRRMAPLGVVLTEEDGASLTPDELQSFVGIRPNELVRLEDPDRDIHFVPKVMNL